MVPDEELLALKRELNATYLKHGIKSPMTDEAILDLLSVLGRIEAHSSQGEWTETLISSALISLGNRMCPPQAGALTAPQSEALQALINRADCSAPKIAASAAHSLGMMRRSEGIRPLQQMIQSKEFIEDPAHPMRVLGVAFRALLRIDPPSARSLIGSRAYQEYLSGVENWRRKASADLLRELDEEFALIHEHREGER